MPYAARTTVPVDRTKAEIETTLTKYGADRFAYFVEPKGAVVIFEAFHAQMICDFLTVEELGEKMLAELVGRAANQVGNAPMP
jgi:hypothetical protein